MSHETLDHRVGHLVRQDTQSCGEVEQARGRALHPYVERRLQRAPFAGERKARTRVGQLALCPQRAERLARPGFEVGEGTIRHVHHRG